MYHCFLKWNPSTGKNTRISAQEPRISAQEPRIWFSRYKHYMGQSTYAHASASQICLQNICGQQQNFPMAGPTFGSKSGPQNGAQAKT